MKRFGSRVLVAGLLFGLMACSSSQPTAVSPRPSATPSATPSASASSSPMVGPSVAASVPEEDAEAKIAQVDLQNSPATAKYGLDRVESAYKYVAFLATSVSYRPEVMRDQSPTPEKLAFVRDFLTVEGQRQWDESLAAALQGDANAVAGTQAFTSYALRGEGLSVNPDGKVVTNIRVSDGKVDLRSDGEGLQVEVTSVVDLRLLDEEGAAVVVEQQKRVLYVLVENPGDEARPWLVEAWGGAIQVSPLRAYE